MARAGLEWMFWLNVQSSFRGVAISDNSTSGRVSESKDSVLGISKKPYLAGTYYLLALKRLGRL